MRMLVFFATLALLALAAAPLAAQPRGPGRGLFGGGIGNTEQSVTFGLTVGAGVDDNILLGGNFVSPGGILATDPNAKRRSTFGNSSLNLGYSASRSKWTFGANYSTAATYYPVLASPWLVSHNVGLGGTLKVWQGGSLSVGESVAYSPLYFLPSFPTLTDTTTAQPVVVDENLGARIESHLNESTTVGLSQRVSKRLSLQFDASHSASLSQSHDRDLSTTSAGGGGSYNLARGLDFRLGFHQSVASYQTDIGHDHFKTSSLDAGLAFGRTLALSRRTRVSFNTGTAALTDGHRTQFTLTGAASISYAIGRSWSASAGYNRSVGFVESFRQPVFSDSLSLGLGGSLSRRVQVQAGGGVSAGTIGFGNSNNHYKNYYGSAGLNLSVTRTLGFGVNYSYFRYGYDSGIELPTGLLPRANRQQIQAFLSLSESLFHRMRRPDASR